MFSGLVIAWRLATWPTSRSPLFEKADDGGGSARTLFICNHFGLAAFEDGDARVGGAEVNSDNFCHVWGSCLRRIQTLIRCIIEWISVNFFD